MTERIHIPRHIGTEIESGKPFILPADYASQRNFITGKSGRGKSVLAGILMEQMAADGEWFGVIDPRGAHIGLRNLANKDQTCSNRASGIEPLIVGGENGDIPLVHTAGAEIAAVLIETKRSFIINIKQTGPKERQQFLTDFGRYLYAHNRDLLHLFIEEADEIIPQQSDNREEQAIRHIWRQIVKGGRSDGLLTTIISQQPQAVEKRSINASDCLLVLGLMGTTDIKAVRDWLENHVTDRKQLQDIMQSIVMLPKGEAWVLAPEWLGKMVRIKVRERVTYHAGRTPRRGEERTAVKPYALGDVVEKVKGMMAAKSAEVAEKMRSERDLRTALHAAELKIKAAEKEREALIKKGAGVASDVAQGVYGATQKQLMQANEKLSHARQQLEHEQNHRIEFVKTLDGIVDRVADEISSSIRGSLKKMVSQIVHAITPKPLKKLVKNWMPPVIVNLPAERTSIAVRNPALPPAANGHITPAQHKVLHAVAEWAAIGQQAITRVQCAFMCGYSATSGGFNNMVGSLVTAGYLTIPSQGMISLTHEGRALAGDVEIAHDNSTILHRVLSYLTPAQAKLMKAIHDSYPNAITREDLAGETGYSVTSGGFNNMVGTLSSAGLITIPKQGSVKVAEWMFVSWSIERTR